MVWAHGSKGKAHNGGDGTEAGSLSKKLRDHTFTDTAHRKQRRAESRVELYSQNPPPVMYFLQESVSAS